MFRSTTHADTNTRTSEAVGEAAAGDSDGLLPLRSIPIGSTVQVAASNTNPRFTRRLHELGIRPGTSMQVLQKAAGGGRVVLVNQSRYALGRSLTSLIQVTMIAA